MIATGLVTEYNPFHNGHLHHLRESLRICGADVAVAVMSGHFLQRGEPALADKWVRARMALAAGVDVVIELPFAWACNSAPHFAAGAIGALDALGAVDAICFGSESGDIEALQRCASFLDEQGARLDEATGAALRRGVNYPTARAAAVSGHGDGRRHAPILAHPNNILAVAYLRALRSADSAMRPVTVRRIGAGYGDTQAVEGIASATGIRHMMQRGEDPAPYLPPEVEAILRQAVACGAVADADKMLPLLLCAIFRGEESLQRIYLVEDGIEKRLLRAADGARTYRELVSAVKSRHMTRTRVQRLLAHVLNEVSAEEMDAHLRSGPLYLHLLGASARGREFLAACRTSLRVPLVANYSRIHSVLKRRYGSGTPRHGVALRQLALELRATRNYTLLLRQWSAQSRNRDFFEPRAAQAGAPSVR